MPEVEEIMGLDGVELTKGDMCAFGMYQDTDGGRKLVLKPTGFMTNASEIGNELNKRCDGNHSYITVVNERAKKAQVYPDELRFDILKGLLKQMTGMGEFPKGGSEWLWQKKKHKPGTM